MNKLRQLEQQVENLRSKVKAARKADRDVGKLVEWLDELVNETEDYRNAPWYDKEKLSQSHSYFFKGQTRKGREIAKRFLRWKATRRSAAEVEVQADELLKIVHDAAEEIDEIEAAEQWDEALETFELGKEPVNDPAMANVDLVLIDLSGKAIDLEHTLQSSKVDFASFHSATLVSPWPTPPIPEGLSSLHTESVDSGFFDLFSRLDLVAKRQTADFVMFMSVGSALMEPLQLPDNWKDHAFILPNHLDASNRKSLPVWDRIDLPKNSLFPQHPACFLVQNAWLKEDRSSFQHFLSYRPWNLWLRAIHQDHGFLQLANPSVLSPTTEEPDLSALNRRWLMQQNPDLLPELRSAVEEWDILKHDLINRVVDHNLEFFQKHVAYYAAVSQTGIIR
tara:strand:+ start:2801 stop:3979 length:1179 start_codon:yes stop_codon:yes gene_type:complete